MQTDDVLRTYPEYRAGRHDYDRQEYHPENYPLISRGGAFLKKAYQLGYFDRHKETTEKVG